MESGDKMPNNLKKLRENAGYTQTEFAKLLGVSLSHLNKIENHGGRNLTVHKAMKAAQILNVSLNEIFLNSNCSE
jgi:transcriptional regulator with XRE-family HTH domain